MSRIFFHSPSERTVGLLGSERAYMGIVCADIACGIIRPDVCYDRLRALISPSHYMAREDRTGPGWLNRWSMNYATAFRTVTGNGLIAWKGVDVDTFQLQLNTVLAVGNDVLRLMARLHGQCEIHAYVEGADREWLAAIIERGRETALLRPTVGWESVIDLLRRHDDEPVVTSYSVCGGFPGRAGYTGCPHDEAALDAWLGAPPDLQWERGMAWARAHAPRLQPDKWGWPDYYFGSGLTVFDILAPDYAARLDHTIGLVSA